mmetsp:Transcript_19718/g.54192  ORF Transcript_19718/g.54192 Transcript_19718/m.54192 type:complete len:263 (-) Transcript_19718:372-1160(-)
MANLPQRKRRAIVVDRCMDEMQKTGPQESVLLDVGALNNAMRDLTMGGKKKIDGLYLADGRKVESTGEDEKIKDVVNKTAKRDLNLQKVARLQNHKNAARKKSAQRTHKSEEELNDEESERKAKAIMSECTEHERIMYKDLFSFFDVDEDRTWGSIEFAQRMTDIGHMTNVEEASNLLYFAGVRDVDRITFDDFVQMMPKLKAFRRLIEEDAMRAFAARDPGTGCLTTKALKLVLQDLGGGPDGLDQKQINAIVKKSEQTQG